MTIPVYLRILLSVSVLACAATWWHGQDREGQSTGAGPGTSAAVLPASAPVQRAELPATPPRSAPHGRVDLFPDQRPQRQAPAEAPAMQTAAEATPAPPAAPALPFTLVGAWWDGAERTLILDSDGAAVLACGQCTAPGAKHVGDVVAANYRIKRIERARVVFTYLPIQVEQVLALDELAFKPEP